MAVAEFLHVHRANVLIADSLLKSSLLCDTVGELLANRFTDLIKWTPRNIARFTTLASNLKTRSVFLLINSTVFAHES